MYYLTDPDQSWVLQRGDIDNLHELKPDQRAKLFWLIGPRMNLQPDNQVMLKKLSNDGEIAITQWAGTVKELDKSETIVIDDEPFTFNYYYETDDNHVYLMFDKSGDYEQREVWKSQLDNGGRKIRYKDNEKIEFGAR